jgi:hypothetical protein
MPVATLAVVVVFPTPPLPEVMTTTFDTVASLIPLEAIRSAGANFWRKKVADGRGAEIAPTPTYNGVAH